MILKYNGISGVFEHYDNNTINIYPSPTSEFLNLDMLNNQNRNYNFQIKIFDITGTEVYNAIVTNSPSSFNLGYLADGMYILKLYNDVHSVSKKIVLQR